MIKIPSNLSMRDVSQWLRGGVFMMEQAPDEFYPYKAASVDGNILMGYELRGHDRWGVTKMRVEDVIERGYAFWPMTGYYNVRPFDAEKGKTVAVCLSRVAARQYRRTYNPDPMRLEVLDEWGSGINGADMPPDYPDLVRQFVPGAAEYPRDLETALEMMSAGLKTVAVTRHIALIGQTVLYRGGVVGTVFSDYSGPRLSLSAGTTERCASVIRKGLRV